MIVQNLAALHVIIPMIAAALCALVRSGNIAWIITFTACALSFIACIFLLINVNADGIISYFMGNWGVAENYDYVVGIEYRIDTLNSFVLLLVSFIGLVMLPYARKSIESEITKEKQPLIYVMYLLCTAGMLGILTTNDLFNIYVFVEISSLATYVLISQGKNRKSLTSAFEYLILGTIGATFILIGIGLLYMMTGTLNLTEIAQNFDIISQTKPVEAAFAFIILGLAMKIALFPLHIWLTNSYCYAPSVVSAFLASTATKVMLYVLIRIIYSLFGTEYSFVTMPLSNLLLILAVLGIIIGSVTAIFQPDIKRMLAFSSVAQLGYMALALALVTQAGLAASIVQLANHALAKGLLFLTVGAVYLRTGGVRLENFNGIAQYMPLTMAAFIVGGLSLIGVPLTAGFVSKWALLQALIEQSWWPLVILLVMSSILAIIYIWQVVEVAYFGEYIGKKKIKEAPKMMLFSIWALVFANIYFGLETQMTLDIANQAATELFYGGIN